MKKTVCRLCALLLCLLLCAPPALAADAIDLPGTTLPDTSKWVAQVGEDGYDSLSEAIDKAPEGSVIRLLQSTVEDCTADKRLTIERNGNHYASGLSAADGFVLHETDEAYNIYAVGFEAVCREESGGYVVDAACHYDVEPTPESAVARIVAACYDEDGRFLKAAVNWIYLSPNGTAQLTLTTEKSAATVKVMILNREYMPYDTAKNIEIDAGQG